jgi:hypothetical protein
VAYNTTILADSPLAYWKLDESSGATQFADSSGNSHPATIAGTPVYSTASKVDIGSIQFDATQYGSITSGAWFGIRSTFSVEAWFSTTTTGLRMLIGYDNIIQNPGNPTRVFQFYLSGGQVIFLPLMSSGSYAVASSPATTYNDGAWHHAVGTYDGTSVRLFIDGTQVASVALSGSTTDGGGQPILLGSGFSNSPGNTYQYIGYLDELAIYGTALNASQVTAHYNAGVANLTTKAQIESVYEEALLTSTPPAQVEALYTESMLQATPLTQVEAVYGETMLQITPYAQIESSYIEVLLVPGPPLFKGWGMPI